LLVQLDIHPQEVLELAGVPWNIWVHEKLLEVVVLAMLMPVGQVRGQQWPATSTSFLAFSPKQPTGNNQA